MTPRVVATDVSPEILTEARLVTAGTGVILEQADALHLPFSDGEFDVVTCSLALHHFEPLEARRVLSEMWRVARRGIVVADLSRGRTAYLATWLATHLVASNRLTRHDGPVSVLRAYTPIELSELAREAGLERFEVRRRFPFRQVLVARRSAREAPRV
jgi:ubiquinone/menaquinone biosynthesis C-methylase UbiE